MKKHAKIVIAVAVITILLTTVSALALGAGKYINPLVKSKSGFVFNGQGVGNSVAGDGYGHSSGYVPASALPTPMPTPIPAVTTAPIATVTPDTANASAYDSFTGTIKEITPFYQNEKAVSGKFFVLVENSEGGIMNFIVDNATINVTKSQLKVGSTFTGFYMANQPMLMIYPPQIYAEVAVIDLASGKTVKVDLFDQDLVSKDGTLKLNLDVTTTVVLQDGSDIDSDTIGNRRMVVVYSASTRSMPAQTTPETVIVLYEQIRPAN